MTLVLRVLTVTDFLISIFKDLSDPASESKTQSNFCQTPLQLTNPTQLHWVGVGVDFVFPQKEGIRRRTIFT